MSMMRNVCMRAPNLPCSEDLGVEGMKRFRLSGFNWTSEILVGDEVEDSWGDQPGRGCKKYLELLAPE